MIGVNLQREVNMSIFGQTKGTELERQIAQLAAANFVQNAHFSGFVKLHKNVTKL